MTQISIKEEMADFRYDDVLLNWEITGNGKCISTYSGKLLPIGWTIKAAS